MLIPKKDRNAIYYYLFKEGVLVTKKDLRSKHPDISYVVGNVKYEVSNLYVINLMKSMKSRGYVTEKFCWNHFYFYLTNEGIEYLREYLHLPEEVIPNTLQKQQARPQTARPATGGFGGGRRFQKGEATPESGFKPTFDQGYSAPQGDRGTGGGYYSRGAGRGKRPDQ